MTESAIANVFLTFRVLLVGGMLLLLPRITRKGLLFGAYVGEELAEGKEAQELLRSWTRACVMLMALSLLVGYGIALAGQPLSGNLTGTAVLLLGALGLYLWTYPRARKLAPRAAQHAQRAVASLRAGEPRGARLARLTLGLCIFAGLVTVAYALIGYRAMPERVPLLGGLFGEPQGTWHRSLIAVMFVPSLNLLLGPFFALLAMLTASAKLSVRGGSGGHSLEAQEAFRATYANVLSVMALLICALLTLLSVQIVRFELSQTHTLGVGVWLSVVAMPSFGLVSVIRLVRRHGQGGALRERGSVEAPLTGGVADNAHWVWGLFYVDRNDPSIMVEKRFGLGYTLNYGNGTAVLIVATFLVLLLSLFGLLLGTSF